MDTRGSQVRNYLFTTKYNFNNFNFRAALIREMIEVLESGYIDIPNSNIQQNLSDSLVEGCRKRMYQKLSDRPTCGNLTLFFTPLKRLTLFYFQRVLTIDLIA